MDDITRSLIRFVVRAFHSRSCILVADAVMLHSVLSEDDLIHLLGIPRKELRAYCARLVEDRLLLTHVQKEENYQQRLANRTYYYIHITEAIDAIKWKVHSIVSTIKDEMSSFGNPHGYLCPRCGRKVSQLDAISLLSDDKSSFVCDQCGGVLVEDDSSLKASVKQERLEKLMIQIDPIISYLKKIDNSNIEDNNFEMALTKAIPAQSGSAALYNLSGRGSSKKGQMSQSLQNAASKANATLHVSITASDENYEREQQEKEERRQKLEQNALPSWHSASTVGQKDYNGEEEAKTEIKQEPEVKTENGTGSAGGTGTAGSASPPVEAPANKEKDAQDVLAAYYADLAEREAEEEEEEDDDEFDFEDV